MSIASIMYGEAKRSGPKPVFSMSETELCQRLEWIEERMKSASKNFEFYYYEELKEETKTIQGCLENFQNQEGGN